MVKLKKGFGDWVAEALENIETIEVAEARQLHGRDDVQFIDVRDLNELAEGGTIPGAAHAPRGMLEFLADPDSPYHNKVFSQNKKFVLFCASGGRSSLAAWRLKEMGFDNICHLAGGFKGWRHAGGEVAEHRADSD